jgi:hypothetical protein
MARAPSFAKFSGLTQCVVRCGVFMSDPLALLMYNGIVLRLPYSTDKMWCQPPISCHSISLPASAPDYIIIPAPDSSEKVLLRVLIGPLPLFSSFT